MLERKNVLTEPNELSIEATVPPLKKTKSHTKTPTTYAFKKIIQVYKNWHKDEKKTCTTGRSPHQSNMRSKPLVSLSHKIEAILLKIEIKLLLSMYNLLINTINNTFNTEKFESYHHQL